MSGVAWHHILLLFYHHFNSFMQNLQKKVWIFENLTNMLRISFKLAHCTAAIFSSLLSAARTEQNLAISADLRPGAVTHTRHGSWCYTYLHPATVSTLRSPEIGQPILPLYGHSLVNHHRVNSVLVQFSHFPNMPQTFS